MLAAAVLLAGTLASCSGDEEPSTQPSTSESPTRTDGTPANASDSICGLPAGDGSIPQEGPEADWMLIDGVPMPTSEEHGPGAETDGIHSCFAHTPTGALFAYEAFLADSYSSENAPADVFRARVVDDANRERQIDDVRGQDRGEGNQGVNPVGFAFLAYSPTTTTINFAYSVEGAAGYVSIPATLQWQDGDWYVVAPPAKPPAAKLNDLDGYVEWSGL